MAVDARLKPRSRHPNSTWPPSAEPQGIELSLIALLFVSMGLLYLGWTYHWAAPLDRGPIPFIRWHVMGQVVELIVWLMFIFALGWRKATGLVTGSFSWWALLPLVALGVASVAAAGRAEEAWVGAGPQFAIAVGVLVAALQEEVVFRGFLYHGLIRRLGGTAGVLTSSLLFAVYHIPVTLLDGVHGTELFVRLVSHFAFGMYMCRVRAKTGSIWFPTAIHTLWNLTTIDIAIWAIPDGHRPASFALIRIAMDGAGLLIAYGFLLRMSFVRAARQYVSGPPSNGRSGTGARTTEWRAVYGAFAQPPAPALFERCTDRARRAVVLAQEEARSEGAETVGTEHLLLALIHENDGAASQALREWRIQLGAPTRLEDLFVARGEDAPTLPFDTDAKRALQLAGLEADAWDHPQIGTEHLLIGLTALRRSEAARVLRTQRVSPVWLRRTTLRLLSERAGPATESITG